MGPKEKDSMFIRAHFQSLVQNSLPNTVQNGFERELLDTNNRSSLGTIGEVSVDVGRDFVRGTTHNHILDESQGLSSERFFALNRNSQAPPRRTSVSTPIHSASEVDDDIREATEGTVYHNEILNGTEMSVESHRHYSAHVAEDANGSHRTQSSRHWSIKDGVDKRNSRVGELQRPLSIETERAEDYEYECRSVGDSSSFHPIRSACSLIALVPERTHAAAEEDQLFDAVDDERASYYSTTNLIGTDAETKFSIWLKENKVWIDLYYRHNVTKVVMDDILRNIRAPFRCWKTVLSRMYRESGILDRVFHYLMCPGHMCFYRDDIMECSVCSMARPRTGDADLRYISWITLRGPLSPWLKNKDSYNALYEYYHSALKEQDDESRDFFQSECFRRVLIRYGGPDNIKNDIFITVSTDGFQAFRKQTHTVWPIAAIICNLDPSVRYKMRNVVPFTFIPGPTEPEDLQSFPAPLIEEMNALENDGNGTEFEFFDGTFIRVRVHCICFTGDLPALKELAGLKGHNGKAPCRHCKIKGIWSVPHRHYYFPSFVSTPNGNSNMLYDPFQLPLRSEEDSRSTITHIEQTNGQERSTIQTETGVSSSTILLQLSTIIPFRSCPIDVMHLFCNICKDIIRMWVNDKYEKYSISKNSLRQIDSELRRFGEGISSKVGCRPRALTRYAEWKSAEVKAFILSYSLVVLDGYLPEPYLSWWRDFVDIVDLCWRPVLRRDDVGKLQVMCRRFFEHFESPYYMGDKERLNVCKYTIHLLLHLPHCVLDCGPPLNYSQYWMERYIGWTLTRMNSRTLAASSLFRDVQFVKAYKIFFSQEHSASDECILEEGFRLQGRRHRYVVRTNISVDDILATTLQNYLIRKYDGLTSAEALEILELVEEVDFRQRICFSTGNDVQNASTKLVPGTPDTCAPRIRENCHVACEMVDENVTGVYYGRILMLFEFQIPVDMELKWSHWQNQYKVGLFDWVSGLEENGQQQVFKRTRSEDAFTMKTVEDLSVVSRLISVVDHIVPSGTGQNRGRQQC